MKQKIMINEEFSDVIAFICDQDVSQAIDRIRHGDQIIYELKRLENTLNTSKAEIDLDLQSLKKLIEFFTLIERRLKHWRRMSTSVIPTLLAKAKVIGPDEYPILIDWIYKHKHPENIWLPFGAIKYGELNSYDDYLAFSERETARLLKHDILQIQQQQEATIRRENRLQSHVLRQQSSQKK